MIPVPALADDHEDFEYESMVIYTCAEGPSWLVGQVLGVDHSSPLLELHRFGSIDQRKGKNIAICKFRPAFLDPKDGLQVYTNKPLPRYVPILDIVSFSDILVRSFHLTNKKLVPLAARRSVASMPGL